MFLLFSTKPLLLFQLFLSHKNYKIFSIEVVQTGNIIRESTRVTNLVKPKSKRPWNFSHPFINIVTVCLFNYSYTGGGFSSFRCVIILFPDIHQKLFVCGECFLLFALLKKSIAQRQSFNATKLCRTRIWYVQYNNGRFCSKLKLAALACWVLLYIVGNFCGTLVVSCQQKILSVKTNDKNNLEVWSN